MLKSSIIYLLLSILVVFFAKYAHMIVVYVLLSYTYLNVVIAPVFSHSALMATLRQVVSLVLLPILIAGIPALLYYAIKRRKMPYFFETTWLLWLLIVLGKVLIY